MRVQCLILAFVATPMFSVLQSMGDVVLLDQERYIEAWVGYPGGLCPGDSDSVTAIDMDVFDAALELYWSCDVDGPTCQDAFAWVKSEASQTSSLTPSLIHGSLESLTALGWYQCSGGTNSEAGSYFLTNFEVNSPAVFRLAATVSAEAGPPWQGNVAEAGVLLVGPGVSLEVAVAVWHGPPQQEDVDVSGVLPNGEYTVLVKTGADLNYSGSGGGLADALFALHLGSPDLDSDGIVDGTDLGLLLSAWGPCEDECPADLTFDGVVDGEDVGLLLAAWGM